MIRAKAADDTWHGIYSAMLTPLTADESLDEAACEELVRHLLQEGQHGLYLTGNTGEGYGLDDQVRASVFRVATRTISSNKLSGRTIAHIGSVHTRRAVALAREAADAGCDAVAAVPPSGGRYSYEELTDYYRTLATATPLPLFVYHIPQTTGYDFDREKLSRWLELPNVQGIKFTDYDFFRLERLITLHADRSIFSGPDQLLMQAVLTGAAGAIGTSYNLAGPLALRIYEAARQGDVGTALCGQQALNVFIERLHETGGARAFKTLAARRFGWEFNGSPAPGRPVSTEAVDLLEEALEEGLRVARSLGDRVEEGRLVEVGD